MCVTVSREYPAPEVNPESAGRFANAAALSILKPADWQICQDLEQATNTALREELEADAAATVVIEVTVHSHSVEVNITGAWEATATLQPRTPFVTKVHCKI